jgi:hypothetical protein
MLFYVPPKFMKYLRTWVYFYVLSLVARKVCRHLHGFKSYNTFQRKEIFWFWAYIKSFEENFI